MGSQEALRVSDSSLHLAVEAVAGRLQALNEYLLVYHAGARPGERRARDTRELRYDIERLHAWGCYLRASVRRPPWWRMLTALGGLAGGARRAASGHRRHPRRAMRRLSSFSVIDRAYVSLLEDFQGRLLTLGLRQGKSADIEQCRARLLESVEKVRALREALAAEAGRVTVVCVLLGRVLRLRDWLGLGPPAASGVEP
jgi:hypothetical protein